MIEKRCLACDHFQDDCIGSEASCGKWKRLDFDRAALGPPKSTAVILPTIPPTIVSGGELVPEHEHAKPPIAAGETRQQKFDRIGKKRQEQALEAVRKLEHLTSRYYRKRSGVTAYTYEWTAEQALDLLRPIENALEKLKNELMVPDPPLHEHGLIEESSVRTCE